MLLKTKEVSHMFNFSSVKKYLLMNPVYQSFVVQHYNLCDFMVQKHQTRLWFETGRAAVAMLCSLGCASLRPVPPYDQTAPGKSCVLRLLPSAAAASP